MFKTITSKLIHFDSFIETTHINPVSFCLVCGYVNSKEQLKI